MKLNVLRNIARFVTASGAVGMAGSAALYSVDDISTIVSLIVTVIGAVTDAIVKVIQASRPSA
jgi:hypothetical protein